MSTCCMHLFSHSSVSYALFRYALYTVVTHVSYANSVTRFIRRALRSYAVTQLRILYPTPETVLNTDSVVCVITPDKRTCRKGSLKIIDLKNAGQRRD